MKSEQTEKVLVQLKQRCKNYFDLLAKYKVPDVYSDNILDYIFNLKRPCTEKIGVYQNISVFEALNRIASDLVLWYGLEILIKEVLGEEEISECRLCLGNEDDKEHGDFSIRMKGETSFREGEVFNAAESFFKRKMQYTKNKWIKRGKPLHYILCNKDGYPERYSPENVILWEKGITTESSEILLIKVDLQELFKKGKPFAE